MNIQNMKKLRDHIAGLDPRLVRMHEWVGGEIKLNGHCGTTACIAGHCWIMEKGTKNVPIGALGTVLGQSEIVPWCQDFLDLNWDESDRLFYDMPDEFRDPPAKPQTLRKREKEWVLRRLDRCIKLGAVPSL